MKWLKKLYNKIRYRKLYKELKEAQAELAEFQAALDMQRSTLKKELALYDTVVAAKEAQVKPVKEIEVPVFGRKK